MSLIERLQQRIFQADLDIEAVHKRIAAEEKEARREKRSVPRALLDRLNEDLRTARGNAFSAQCALGAARRYPPCH